MKTHNPQVSYQQFTDETCILPDVVARTVLDNRKDLALGDTQREWFVNHVVSRSLHLYANSPTWRKRIQVDLGVYYAFVGHWLKAMLYDVEAYQERHATP